MTDQCAPAPTTPDDWQAAHWARREPLLNLLGRLTRGVLADEERPLLRAAVETELAATDRVCAQLVDAGEAIARRVADMNRQREAYDRQADRLRKTRQQRREARAEAAVCREDAESNAARAEQAEQRTHRTLAHIAEAPLNVDVWARLGMALGWTPERAGTEARKRRLHGEQQLAATADALRQQLAAAKAESDGLAETMRNTDRLTEKQLAEARAEARAEVASLRERFTDAHERHNRRRLELAHALGCSRDTGWPDLVETTRRMFEGGPVRRAAVVDAEQRARTAESRHGELDTQRVAALRLLSETEKQLGEARATLSVRRDELAHALGRDSVSDWGELVEIAASLPSVERQLTDMTADRDGWWKRAEEQGETIGRRMDAAEAALAAVRKVAAEAYGTSLPGSELRGYAEQAIVTIDARSTRCCSCGSTEVTYRNYREQPFCGPCADGDRPEDDLAGLPPQACGDIGGHPAHRHAANAYTSDATVYRCPGVAVSDLHPRPDGATMWAAIRDHAARDTPFWRNLTRNLNALDRRGLL